MGASEHQTGYDQRTFYVYHTKTGERRSAKVPVGMQTGAFAGIMRLRIGDDDAGKEDQPKGTRELRALEEQAGAPSDASETGKFLRLAIENPKATLILAHLGAVRFHEMAVFGMVRQFSWYPRNVWFDLSAVAAFHAKSPYRDELVWVIRSVGTDRVLFGSDWPVDPPARAAQGVRDLGLTADEQRQIYFTNAQALLHLE